MEQVHHTHVVPGSAAQDTQELSCINAADQARPVSAAVWPLRIPESREQKEMLRCVQQNNEEMMYGE